MKWFFRWLHNGISEIEAQAREEREQDIYSTQSNMHRPRATAMKMSQIKGSKDDGYVNLNQSALSFRLYPATGGHIVEYSYYNEKTDMNQQALHLIPSDADLGDSLSKIMTLEALRR